MLHAKNVIHMKLFLSNIMWKKEDGESFSVILVDFDAVHSLDEPLVDAVFATDQLVT